MYYTNKTNCSLSYHFYYFFYYIKKSNKLIVFKTGKIACSFSIIKYNNHRFFQVILSYNKQK